MLSANQAMARRMLAGLATVVALSVAASAMAQAVVVRSSGPSAATYPQGRKLPANAKVTLKAGDKVTVLDKAGSRVLSGPGAFTLDNAVARDAGAATRVAGVLASTGGARARTGAVRGAGAIRSAPLAAPAGPDNVWYIDVSKGGAYCVANPGSLVLWRPNRAEEASAKLAPAGGKPVEIVWKKGNPLKLWPAAELPVTDRGNYTFSDPVGPTVTITLHLVGAPPADDLAVAGMLADKGCMAQLDVFANAATPAPEG